MTDGINAGLQSDRLEICWQLNDEHVKRLASGFQAEPSDEKPTFVLSADEANNPVLTLPTQYTHPHYAIQIPHNINTLKQDNMPLAKSWQMAIREAMLAVIKAEYIAIAFIAHDDICCYNFSVTT